MLDTVERAPRVLCEELNDARECFFRGDGVMRRFEERVLLCEIELCVLDLWRLNFESF